MKVKILKPVQTKYIQYYAINSVDKCVGKVYNVVGTINDYIVIHLNGYIVSLPSSCCQVKNPIISKLK